MPADKKIFMIKISRERLKIIKNTLLYAEFE